jgi:DNA-binding winged helix-turn-helix (wHTH) protein
MLSTDERQISVRPSEQAEEALIHGMISFGPFRLSASERRLIKDGVPVEVGSRALDILITLVERAGEVVCKKELFARAWPDVLVDETSLRTNVARLRRALGDGWARGISRMYRGAATAS